jgi:NDP-sugar pyrophosphorylase family protein
MKAVILAGGKGQRLAPYTSVLPKPLLPVGDMPILEIMIRQLRAHGIDDIILSVGYLGALLETYFGHGEKLGVKIRYSYEQQPLGTAGPLSLVSGLDEPFFVMNGDLLTTLDYRAMYAEHRRHGELATIGLARKPVRIDLGVIYVNEDGTLKDYVEKPVLDYLVSMGIYVFSPAVLDYIPAGKKFDLPDLVLKMKSAGNRVMTYDSGCQWLDIGRPEDYAVACDILEKDRGAFLPPSTGRP